MTLTDSSLPEFRDGQRYDLNTSSKHNWDINDTVLPVTSEPDVFNEWPDGHCRQVYSEDLDESRRHISGWAMRNTNNHNVNILKKSCLGVLVCQLHCSTEAGNKVHLRPAICDKARRKQLGKKCPNPSCNGRLELMPCRGHCGYPVTHFWRHCNGLVYFQAKGVHDHPKPEVKTTAEARRHLHNSSRGRFYTQTKVRRQRKRPARCLSPAQDDTPKAPRLTITGKEFLCSCPPFECTCSGSMGTSFDLGTSNLDTTWTIPTSEVMINANQVPPIPQTHLQMDTNVLRHSSCMGQQQEVMKYFSSPNGRGPGGYIDHIPPISDVKLGSSTYTHRDSRDFFIPLDSLCGFETSVTPNNNTGVENLSGSKLSTELNRSWFAHHRDPTPSEYLNSMGAYCSSQSHKTQGSMSVQKRESLQDSHSYNRPGPDCLDSLFSATSSCSVTKPSSIDPSSVFTDSLSMFSPIKETSIQAAYGETTQAYTSPNYLSSRQPSPVGSVHSLRSSPPARQTACTPTGSHHSSPSPCFIELQPISPTSHSLGPLPSCREGLQTGFMDTAVISMAVTATGSTCIPSYQTDVFTESQMSSNKLDQGLSHYQNCFETSTFVSAPYNTVSKIHQSSVPTSTAELLSTAQTQYRMYPSSPLSTNSMDCVPLNHQLNNNTHCLNMTLS